MQQCFSKQPNDPQGEPGGFMDLLGCSPICICAIGSVLKCPGFVVGDRNSREEEAYFDP
jgi:hypothetical protein